jgi:hypothetical protein
MGLWGDRTVYNLSNLNYGLAFGMTFKMLLKGREQTVKVSRHDIRVQPKELCKYKVVQI